MDVSIVPRRISYEAMRRFLFWGVAAVVLALDQATKGIVRGYLERGEIWPADDWPVRIRYVTNTGAAFGILENQTLFLILMTFVGLVAIYIYYRNPPFDHFVAPVAVGMMLGGALGNLLDRIRLGRVTDFIDFPRFPAFNVADSAITVGIAAIIIGYLFFASRKVPDEEEERPKPVSHENA
jgi:signal peptidase II